MASCGRHLRRTVAAAVTLGVVAACGASGGGSATVPSRLHDPLCNFVARPPAVYSHVIWIWFENTDAQDVMSAGNAGTFTSELLDRCAVAVNYHNITHPSLPNYIAATSGTVQGDAATTDCAPAECPQQQPSVFDQVHAAGEQWRAYVQSPQPPCGYATAAYYPSLVAQCAASVVALGDPSAGALHGDLTAATLPAYAFILPDGSDDTGPPADRFLNDWVTAITSSPTYREGTTAILITWDEGGTDRTAGERCDDKAHADVTAFPGCNVAFIAVGPAVGQTRSSEYFTHYSLLRTTEEMLGISMHLSNAATARSMRAALHI